MRGILNSAAAQDPRVGRALAVLTAFDRLVAAEADIATVVATAAELSGRSVVVVDVWNDVSTWSDPPGGAGAGTPGTEMVRLAPSATPEVVEGRLTVAVEIASGRIGAVWLEPGPRGWEEIDHVVLERLAGTVAIVALRTHRRAVADREPAFLPLERLLSGQFADDDDASVLVRRCGFDPAADYVTLAVGSSGTARTSPEAASQAVRDLLARAGVDCRAGTIGDVGAVVARQHSGLEPALTGLADDPRARALHVVVAAGSARRPQELGASWTEARRTLAMASAVSSPGPTVMRFGDLGALALLTQIPAAEVEALPDVVTLRRLAARPGGDTQLAVLRAYCETGSLRLAAGRVHLHHSSVAYRLTRLEQELGFGLDDAMARLRALLALNLLALRQL